MMSDDRLQAILSEFKRVAVVGMSKSPDKEAHTVPKYLLEHGYDIIPVNPTATEILGLRAFPNLKSIPREYDIVTLFRPGAEVPPFVDEAIEHARAKVIWMQSGIRNDEAARKAEQAGLVVVQDRCMRTEHRRLAGSWRPSVQDDALHSGHLPNPRE